MMIDDMSGGLNTRLFKIKEGQSPHMQNVYVDEEPGSLAIRNGMVVAGSTVGPGSSALQKVNFMKEYVAPNNTRGFFVSDSSKVLYTTDFSNWVLIKATLTATAQLRATQGLGWMAFSNGVDPFFVSSGLPAIPLDGTNGFPNAPRSKYVAFFLERFFLLNSSSNPSGLDWSDRISTDGFRIDVTNINAWPVLNHLDISKDDGQQGSGLDVFKGLLQIHKGNGSIYTLFGTDNFTFQPRRTNAHSGAAFQETIAQSDNLEYYFEKSGVYAYDGGDSVRISDDILPDINIIVSNTENIQSDTWDTQSDFSTLNSSFSQTTATPLGYLQVDVTTVGVNNIGAFPTGATNFIFVDELQTSNFAVVRPTQTLPPGKNWEFFGVTLWAQSQASGAGATFKVKAKNNRTGAVAKTRAFNNATGSPQKIVLGYGDNDTYVEIESGYPIWTTSDLTSGNLQIQIDNSDAGTRSWNVYSPTDTAYGEIVFVPVSTGSYISQVTTVPVITAWGTLSPTVDSNIGNVTFYLKAATSPFNLISSTWMQVSPGNTIPFTPNNNVYVWGASVSIKSNAYSGPRGSGFSPLTPKIDVVNINHNEGGVGDSFPKSIEWKKRYLMLVSTEASGTVSTIFVKSRISHSNPNAWTMFTFSNDYFKSMAKFNDNLYFGSGSTGTIYRFDYGTNDNGSPIIWEYDTPVVQFGKPFFKKQQWEYFVEANKLPGGSMQIGTSINDGDFSYITVDLDGTGHFVRSIKSGFPSLLNYATYRFKGTQLDQPIVFHRFGVFYTVQKVRVN